MDSDSELAESFSKNSIMTRGTPVQIHTPTLTLIYRKYSISPRVSLRIGQMIPYMATR